jgi:hypothetical protein
MTDTIYDALRESHEIQRSLLRSLVRTTQAERRQELFTELKVELGAHEAAEERFLYVPMLMDDMGLNSSRHALHEHHQIDELVEDLQGLAIEGKAWGKKAAELSEKVHHHLREEEKKFFQVSGKILTEAQKSREAKRYRRDYERMKKVLRKA